MTARFVPVGRNRYRIYKPPKRMEDITPTSGFQIVKITSAMASQPRSPKASFDQMPQA